jgi:CRISPR-associated endonuclease/helicase Cas3
MVFVEVNAALNKRVPDAQVQGERITAWGQTDYLQALTNLAAELDMPLEKCAQRFGTVTLAKNDNGWRFHPALGFTKAKT